MTVTVTTPVGKDVHPSGLEIDTEFGILTVFAGPGRPVAKYSSGSWMSAVIS